MKKSTALIIPPELNKLWRDSEKESIGREIKRLAELYATHLKNIRLRAEKNFDGVGEQVYRLSKLLYETAELPGMPPLSSIQKVEEMFNRIRTASGLSEIHTWLRGKENAKQIMEESGREMTFRMLWNVHAIRIR